jgi:hypothetical protein
MTRPLLVPDHAGQELTHGGYLLLLHLEGEKCLPLAALDQEQSTADRSHGPDAQPVG